MYQVFFSTVKFDRTETVENESFSQGEAKPTFTHRDSVKSQTSLRVTVREASVKEECLDCAKSAMKEVQEWIDGIFEAPIPHVADMQYVKDAIMPIARRFADSVASRAKLDIELGKEIYDEVFDDLDESLVHKLGDARVMTETPEVFASIYEGSKVPKVLLETISSIDHLGRFDDESKDFIDFVMRDANL